MKLSTREDIDAPQEAVFDAITDFAAIEAQIRRRGIALDRVGDGGPAAPGTQWQAEATWRDRTYRIESELVSIDDGQGYAIESRSNGIVCLTVVDLMALSKTRTRLFLSLDLKPTTLSSRVLIQPLRLAKGRLSDRLSERVADFARRIEGTA